MPRSTRVAPRGHAKANLSRFLSRFLSPMKTAPRMTLADAIKIIGPKF
jgi:hypothetical protein